MAPGICAGLGKTPRNFVGSGRGFGAHIQGCPKRGVTDASDILVTAKATIIHFLRGENLEGSLPCPQEAVTGFYPEPDYSSPYPPVTLV
jgi:hypothetical protein